MMLKKISRCLIYGPALAPLYSIKLVSISIILFSLGAFINYDFAELKTRRIEEIFRKVFPYAVIFFLYCISLLWTEDIGRGLNYIERTLPFLIFPLVIFVLKPFRSNCEIVFFIKLFIISTFLLSIVVFLNIGFVIYDKINHANDLGVMIRKNMENAYFVGEHPIYFSLLLATGIVLLAYNCFRSRFLTVLIYSINISGIIASGSRGVFLTLLLVSMVIVYFKSNDKRKVFLSIVLLTLLAVTVVFVSPLKQRMEQFVNTKKIYPEGTYYNSFNIRMAIYKCSFDIIQSELLLGYGPGDIGKKLDECYQNFNTSAFNNTTYNTHNQYLHYLSAFGIIGTLIILYYFGLYFRSAYTSKNWNYLAILILFYISFLTENILVRNTGIVVFSMFNCIFAYQIKLRNNEKSLSA